MRCAIAVGSTAAACALDSAIIKAPVELTETNQDYDGSGTTRTASGKIKRSVIRGGDNNIRKLELTWSNIDHTEAAKILNLIKAKFFYIKYPDVQLGAFRTMQCYAGDRSYKISYVNDDGTCDLSDFKFNVIEV